MDEGEGGAFWHEHVEFIGLVHRVEEVGNWP